MNNPNWQMLVFVGVSLVHDYWIYYGLPQIQYWELKQTYTDINDKNDKLA